MLTPYQTGYLPEQSGHQVYWQCFGNPSGSPVLFLHGGPGCGFESGYLPLFNLDDVNLITFDQRGCGQSKPFGSVENNTTSALIEDIERLRKLLNINQWIVTGHSWGTTLAIQYALSYPAPCQSICLAAFFGGTTDDQNWTFSGMKTFFPEEIAAIDACKLPDDEHLSLDEWIYKNITSPDKNLQQEMAFRLMSLETVCAQNRVEMSLRENANDELINIYKILFFYAKNSFFIDPNKFYESEQLKMPVTLVHGRYDMDCPPIGAYRLRDSIPQLDLRMVKTGNHSVFEDPMASEYKNAIAQQVKSFRR